MNDINTKMIYLFLPIESGTGWGTCGKYLSLELSKICQVSIVTVSQMKLENIGDEIEWASLMKIPRHVVDMDAIDKTKNYYIEGVSIRTLNDFVLSPWLEHIRSEKFIGYTFYFGYPLSPQRRDSAAKLDLIVAGSSFCEKQLKRAGIDRTKTIIQGINPIIFNPSNSSKYLLKDRFVVFSGGKFEYRKGNDIVIRAFQIFSDKHPDALLINSWFNMWDFSLNTMAASGIIDYTFNSKNYMESMINLYKINGLNPAKVITLPMKPSFQLPYLYKNTDIGLFPNRCEGGTNLMLMEYMACGKPVIASAQTGHADIIRHNNAFPIETYTDVKVKNGNPAEYDGWVEPNIDEIVSLLEKAYDSKEECNQKGEAAGQFLATLTWEKAAREFYDTAMEYI